MDAGSGWNEFPRLAEAGPTMRLPRRTTPLKNVGFHASSGGPASDGGVGRATASGWDLPDLIAVLGAAIFVIGLLVALIPLPQTRPVGVLVPFGLALLAFAAWSARRKDATGF
jgi:hypothetical protein